MSKTRWLVRIASASSISVSTSCSYLPSHIHNADNAATAEALQADLTEYTTNAPTMYQTMLANINRIGVEEDKIISDLATNRDQAFITELPTQNQTQLIAKATAKTGTCDIAPSLAMRLECLNAKILSMSSKYLKEKGIIADDIQSATALRASFREAVEIADRNVTSWNTSIALLSTAISRVPSAITDASNASSVDAIKDLTNLVQKQEIEFLDASGKTRKETIATIVRQDLEFGNLDLPNAPGMKLEILALGLELAEIRRKAAQ